jgi:hypothetical protein
MQVEKKRACGSFGSQNAPDAEAAVACMGPDVDNVGILFDLSSDLRETRRLLWTVHHTIAG